MPRAAEDTAFVCDKCGAAVPRHPAGSYRNHCRVCLWSVHVDVVPGDRLSDCGQLMRPTGLDYTGKKGFIIVHQCTGCGHVDRNRVASDDDAEAIRVLSQRMEPPR